MSTKQRTPKTLRALALLLVLALLCSTGIFAADTSENAQTQTGDYSTNTTTLIRDLTGDFDEMTIETYMSSVTHETKNVKACDIIFVLDQSKWMNGTNGSQRKAIIEAMRSMLENLETPTEEGQEHRIAIAGYGRVNVSNIDPYDATTYPGKQHTGSNISLNTGYYTTSGFQSQNGWTEVADLSSAALPTMSERYQSEMTYDSAFMTVAQAESVLNPDTMLAWNAGASRMDAGLTLAEQLAQIAKEHAGSSDRNLIVCVVASSLPIQNAGNVNRVRDEAAIAAANVLKSEGATIFALGDYRNSGNNLGNDTEEHFQKIMTQICGSSTTEAAEREKYFFSLQKSGSITQSLNQMIAQITVTVAASTVQKATVQVNTDNLTDQRSDQATTWQSWLSDIPAATEVLVRYYAFDHYDENGDPQFSATPYLQETKQLSALLQNGSIYYQTDLIPVQPYLGQDSSAPASLTEGNKVVITIRNPVTVTYHWASSASGYVPGDVTLPTTEKVIYGEAFEAPTLTTANQHYLFDGWYLDAACTKAFSGNTVLTENVDLYGKWTACCLVSFHWNIVHDQVDTVQVAKGTAIYTYAPCDLTGYQFGGWYTDSTLTTAFVSGTVVNQDTDLYAKWVANSYQVVFDNNASDAQGTMENQAFIYGTSQKLTANAYSRTGYTFAGWNTQADGQGESYTDKQSVTNLTATQNGTVTLYAQWTKNTYIISVSVTDGTADCGGPSVTVSHGDNKTITFTAKEGYVLDTVTVDGNTANLGADGSYTFSNVTDNHSIQVVYAVDSNGDGIPDKYQATVTYQVINGTWSDQTTAAKTQLFTLKTRDSSGAWVDANPTLGSSIPTGMVGDEAHYQGTGSWNTAIDKDTAVTGNATYLYSFGELNSYSISVTVTNGTSSKGTSAVVQHGGSQTITFTANEGYVLDTVTVDGNTANLGADGSYTFSDVATNHSIQVVYAVDSNGDGIPDKYQATVTYQVVNGTWSDQTTAAKTQVFTLKTKNDSGVWEDENTTLGSSIPTGMVGDVSHNQNAGSWNTAIDENTAVTGNATYIYTFSQLNSYTITVSVTGGISDPDGTSITVEYGGSQEIHFKANEGYTLDSVLVDGKPESLDELDDSLYFSRVTADHEIQVVYELDQNGDRIPDKYQATVCFVSEDNEKGTVTGDGITQTVTITDGQGNYSTEGTASPSMAGVIVTPANGYVLKNWTKDGVVSEPTQTISIQAGQTVTYTANWQAAVQIGTNTIKMKYKVEHYQEQADGSYILIDTENLAGDLGTTVLAEPKTIEYHHVNTYKSTLSGLLSTKNRAVQLLTLEVYYDRDMVTVTYDPNNGEQTSSETVKHGTTETVHAAPTKEGYTFLGWSDGTNTYQADESFTVGGNVTLTAQWEKIVLPTVKPVIYYTLSYETNGGTEYQDEKYAAGTQVSITKTPVREGYRFTGWYADEALTERITDVTMNYSKTVYAGWVAATVPDQLNGDNHFAYVIGDTEGTVRPEDSITRAEIATIFFRLLKDEIRDGNLTTENPYTDVSESDWYCKAVSTLTALGIITGRTDTEFAPDEPITRAELATVCARFDTGITSGNSSFSDIEGHWAQADIEKAAALGWLQGYEDGTFRPDNDITRAEAMTMINRVLCRIPEHTEDLLENMTVWPDNLDTTQWYYLAVQEATNSHEYQQKGEVYETWTQMTEDPDWTRYQK